METFTRTEPQIYQGRTISRLSAAIRRAAYLFLKALPLNDHTISELENDLDPQKFIRIHRAVLLNADFVDEARAWFGGRLMVRLRDSARTELTVARDRVRSLRAILKF